MPVIMRSRSEGIRTDIKKGQAMELPIVWNVGRGLCTGTKIRKLTSITVDHSDMTIEATRSNTGGVMMSMFLLTIWLF